MRKAASILILTSLISMPLSAQSFLKGLKEAVSEELSRGVADGKDAVSGAKDAVGSIFSGKKKSETKYEVVKPSTAKNAAELLNELPDFPTAAQIAENEDGFRNWFYDRIYAVEHRMDELKKLNCRNASEDDERVEANLMKKLTGFSNPADIMNASGVNTVQQTAGGIDYAKLEKLQGELETLSVKLESGKATEADMKRLTQISEEISVIYTSAMGGMDMNSLMKISEQNAKNAESIRQKAGNRSSGMYDLENDRKFGDFINRLAEMGEEKGASDAGKLTESKTLKDIEATFKKIWAEQDGQEVKRLYTEVNSMIEDFELTRAQARLDQNASLKGRYLSLISEAEKIAAGYSEESLVARYDMLNLPLAVVETYKELLYNVWGSSGDVYASDVVCPVHKIRLDLNLQDGDVIYTAESNIYQMLDDGKIASVYGIAKSAENVEEEFLSKAVLLVKNSKDGNFYKIQGGSRTLLGSKYNKGFDFRKDYYYKERREARIPMKSLDGKALTFNKEHTLFIPIPASGQYYDVLAIQRTEDWIAFITLDGDGQLCKCLFRL